MKEDLKLCAKCNERPQRPTHRYCKECHAEYMREHRKRVKAERKKLEMTHCPHCGEALVEDSDHVVAKEADNG